MNIPFDFSTSDILAWELQAIHQALGRQEIEISDHAYPEAGSENIPYVAMPEAILVGLPGNKDLPGNPFS